MIGRVRNKKNNRKDLVKTKNVLILEILNLGNVRLMWPTHVEIMNLTTDAGGPEPVSFRTNLANEVHIRKIQ